MQNLDQQLTNEQLNLKNNPNPPKGWNDPNPVMYATPFMWDSLYTSPAWGSQFGGGYGPTEVSNQFSSAVTQPLSNSTQWLGMDRIPTANTNKADLYGGLVEPSYGWWDRMGKNVELQPIRGGNFFEDIGNVVRDVVKKQKGGKSIRIIKEGGRTSQLFKPIQQKIFGGKHKK